MPDYSLQPIGHIRSTLRALDNAPRGWTLDHVKAQADKLFGRIGGR